MQRISIIVAVSENNAIGKNNQLLWRIPGDLKRFKKLTTGNTVIMGKNTFLSLPNGPLPNRKNVVISDNKEDAFDCCIMAYTIKEALRKCDPDERIFIIGGGMIYKQFLKFANRLYITKIHKSYIADTFFPNINLDEWEEVSREEKYQDYPEKLNFTYLILNK